MQLFRHRNVLPQECALAVHTLKGPDETVHVRHFLEGSLGVFQNKRSRPFEPFNIVGGEYFTVAGPVQIRRFDREEVAVRAGLKNRNFLAVETDRKSTRLNSSHTVTSYADFCLE